MGFLKGRFVLGLAVAAAAVALVGVGVAAANSFSLSSLFDFSKTGRTQHAGPTDGILSPYLVGYYDARDGSDSLAEGGYDEDGNYSSDVEAYDVDDVEVVVYLVNPTPVDLTAYIVLFDNDQDPIYCDVRELSPNDVTDVLLEGISDDDDEFGVVKIVSFDANRPGQRVQAGLKGWMVHMTEQDDYDDPQVYLRETELAEVPTSVLMADRNPRDGQPDELSLIVDYVEDDCAPN